jgi:hypothetical protein
MNFTFFLRLKDPHAFQLLFLVQISVEQIDDALGGGFVNFTKICISAELAVVGKKNSEKREEIRTKTTADISSR